MKRLLMLLFCAVMTLTACGSSVRKGEPHELGNVTVTITDLDTEYNEKTGSTVFRMKFRFDNRSDKDISTILWKKELIGKDGNVINEFTYKWIAENEPLRPGESAEDYFAWQEKLGDNEPDTVRLSVVEYTTDEEVPTVQLPKTGENLFQTYGDDHLRSIKSDPPVLIRIWIDHMGAVETAEISDSKVIGEFVDAFVKIKIKEETQEFVTDNYNGVSFTFADGSEVYLSLNLVNLEVGRQGTYHLYVLENFGEFWSLCNDYADY